MSNTIYNFKNKNIDIVLDSDYQYLKLATKRFLGLSGSNELLTQSIHEIYIYAEKLIDKLEKAKAIELYEEWKDIAFEKHDVELAQKKLGKLENKLIFCGKCEYDTWVDKLTTFKDISELDELFDHIISRGVRYD